MPNLSHFRAGLCPFHAALGDASHGSDGSDGAHGAHARWRPLPPGATGEAPKNMAMEAAIPLDVIILY